MNITSFSNNSLTELNLLLDKALESSGGKYLMSKRFDIGNFESLDFFVLDRLSKIVNSSSRKYLPFYQDAKEFLKIKIMELK